MPLDDQTVEWLLESENPSVRYFALKDLLDEPSNSTRLRAEQAKISGGLFVRSLLSGQQADGGFGVHPYAKWTGAHWRLVSLVELGIPTRHPKAVKMAGPVLEWLTGEKHRDGIKKVEGRARAHASMEGNALAACSKIGLGDDEKVRTLAQALLESQWPDGGWNCDPRPEADHSSFHERENLETRAPGKPSTSSPTNDEKMENGSREHTTGVDQVAQLKLKGRRTNTGNPHRATLSIGEETGPTK